MLVEANTCRGWGEECSSDLIMFVFFWAVTWAVVRVWGRDWWRDAGLDSILLPLSTARNDRNQWHNYELIIYSPQLPSCPVKKLCGRWNSLSSLGNGNFSYPSCTIATSTCSVHVHACMVRVYCRETNQCLEIIERTEMFPDLLSSEGNTVQALQPPLNARHVKMLVEA